MVGINMKPGDLVRSRPGSPAFFSGVPEEWYGVVIYNEKSVSRYNFVKVVLSSQGGIVDKTWMTPEEIKEHIEVINENSSDR